MKKLSESFDIEKTYTDFDDLDEIDKTLMRLQLEKPSISITDLAKELQLSYPTTHRRLNNPSYKRVLATFMDEPLKILLDAQKLAAEKIVAIIKDGKDCDALAAAKTLLYGTGTIVDRRFSQLNIQNNDSRSVQLIISNDFIPKFSPEQLKEAGENNDDGKGPVPVLEVLEEDETEEDDED